jgi:AAHS family 4-hydroxybenzoate transporter-like MFS transporter
MAQRINTKDLIDGNPFGAYQVWVFLLCFLACTVDGYDVQVIGVAVPGIRESLHLESATLGLILTAGQIGVMLGAFCLGPVADRVGRKRMLIATALTFGVFSFLTAFASSVGELVVLRVLAGFGMGGIVPAAMAYGAEYAPHRLRATITTLVWMALPVGGMIAGFSAIWLIPAYGWQSLFVVAGVMPLVLSLLLAAVMPESLAFLSTHGGDQDKMRRIALRIAPQLEAAPDAVFYATEEKLPGVPLKHLFTEGRGLGTILLWIMFFLSFFLMIFCVSWVPSFVRTASGSTTASGTSLMAWNIGSLIATAAIGQMIDRLGYYRILPAAFVLIAVAAWGLGATLTAPIAIVVVLVGVLGFVTGGSNSGLMALASNSYPVAIRSTGVGAAYSLGGRTGALVGPMLGGILLQAQWTPGSICMVMGTPMLLGTVVLLLLQRQAQFRHARAATVATLAPAGARPAS